MARSKLTVHKSAYQRKGYDRKGYRRSAYTRSDGTRVKATRVSPTHIGPTRVPATTYKEKDRGKKGRGPKVVPTLKKGTLGKGYFEKSDRTRHEILKSKGKEIGERRLGGKLRAIQVLNKRTNLTVSRKAAADAKWVYSHFKGKKYVR